MTDTSAVPATLLLVEDDDQVRTFISTLLARDNLRILEARTGAEGLRVAQGAGELVDVLLTDMLLPELSGYDLALQLKDIFPELQVIMMTGYVEGEIVQRGVLELNAAFLDKPFQPSELRRLVAAAVTRSAAANKT
ncbi:MAG: response regulator [Bryobacteraceae bacterium]|nr:response regulator [Bryobacteraceae bacterium]